MNKEEYSFPKELKKLRACSSCGLIKTESQVTLLLHYYYLFNYNIK